MGSPEKLSAGLMSLVMRWHAGVVGCWLVGLVLAFVLSPRESWAWWTLLVPLVASLIFLALAQSAISDRARRLAAEVERLEDKGTLLGERLVAERRTLAERETGFQELEATWAADRLALTTQAEEAARQARLAEEELATLHRDLQKLLEEQRALQREHAESLERRRVLEGQYLDLESTARELGTSNAQRAERQRLVQDDLERLKSTLDEVGRDLESCRTENTRLRSELEKSQIEGRTRDLRVTRLEASTAEWKERAEAAQEDARRQRASRALEEELAARRTEIERLVLEAESLREQRELAYERLRLMESREGEVQSDLDGLRDAMRQQDEVVGRLEAENRRQRLEPREAMMDHFVWRVNAFRDDEVLLNFVNQGAEIDLFEVVSEPPLVCERPAPCTVKRAAEGRVRISSDRPLPREFLVRCRYTLYPQEAVFRIRPAGPVKLERL